jgi:hemerythrin superfamily protein
VANLLQSVAEEVAMPNPVEKAASEVMGVVKSTKARLAGLTGVFQHLAREHGEVTALLLRVKSSSDPKVRAELFPKIREELLSHEKGELAEVYPAFRGNSELEDIASQHGREASELEEKIKGLSTLPYNHPSWADRFSEIVKMVSEHVKEEEGEFFPTAERILGHETADRLLPRYEEAKARAAQAVR